MVCIINGKICFFDNLPENFPTDIITDYINEEEYSYYGKDLSSFKIENGKFVALKTLEEVRSNVLNKQFIPSELNSLLAIGKNFLKTAQISDSETKLAVSGLYEKWTAGKYEIGDICNYAGQTYECTQAHDNATYPDITPENPQTWANFWKPLHGKSATNARPWVKPQFGTTDMYLTGEFMVYTDGKVYKCLSDTVYSPEEYAQYWEIQN